MASSRRTRNVSEYDENTSVSESESNSNGETSHSESGKAAIQKRRRKNGGKQLDTVKRVLTSNNGRKDKCFSRNALLARENRLKKKLYIMNLESELSTTRKQNKKLSSVVDNQLRLIQELKKEVKYLKSVLANSADICKLVRNINHNTGMSVRSSLDSKLSLDNCVSKPRYPMVARKTAHPFEVTGNTGADYKSMYVSSELVSPLFDDFDSILMNDAPLNALDCDMVTNEDLFKDNQLANHEVPLEHNYTCLSKNPSPEEDVGVCLHVSKHRVSLEFCPTCSDRAHQNWDK